MATAALLASAIPRETTMPSPSTSIGATATFASSRALRVTGKPGSSIQADRKSTRLNQSLAYLVCRLLLEKKKKKINKIKIQNKQIKYIRQLYRKCTI